MFIKVKQHVCTHCVLFCAYSRLRSVYASRTISEHTKEYTVITLLARVIDTFYKYSQAGYIPANSGHSPNAVSMLGQRQRRYAGIETALVECTAFAGICIG